MNITYRQGDLFRASQVCLIHGCNNRGAFASGVAGLIRRAHPAAYEAYRRVYEQEGLRLGQCIFAPSAGKLIGNCITQDGYGRDGRRYVNYDAIRECFATVNSELFDSGHLEVAMPMIGAGLGGGDWKVIEQIVEEEFSQVAPIVYYI